MTAADPRAVDVVRLRLDTPGCERLVHFNNAGASLPPRSVVDAMVAHLRLEETIGGYEAAGRADAAREATYDAIATLIGARRDEIALVESATRGWDTIFGALPLPRGSRVLTSKAEYASNVLAMLQASARHGIEIEVVPDDEHGALSVDALADLLDERVALVAVTHVPSQSGLVNPAEAIGAVTRRAGVPFLLDACQSAGQVPLDVGRIGCDFLTATGRKYLRGPRGTGFLYVRREWIERLEPAALDVHGGDWIAPHEYRLRPDARRFETFEASIAGQLALGVAVAYANRIGTTALAARIALLGERLRVALAAIPGVEVHDPGVERCGIVTFTVEGLEPDAVRAALARDRVNVWVVRAGTARFDLDARRLPAVVRASVHAYNTEDEIERVAALVAGLR